jgi:hypothetical protein
MLVVKEVYNKCALQSLLDNDLNNDAEECVLTVVVVALWGRMM